MRDWINLCELFDPIHIEWRVENSHTIEADFTVGDHSYRIAISTGGEDVWRVAFADVTAGEFRVDNTGQMGATGVRVFSAVLSIIEEFIKKREPYAITFSASRQERRDHFYRRMAAALRPRVTALGYEVNETETTHYCEFEIKQT